MFKSENMSGQNVQPMKIKATALCIYHGHLVSDFFLQFLDISRSKIEVTLLEVFFKNWPRWNIVGLLCWMRLRWAECEI